MFAASKYKTRLLKPQRARQFPFRVDTRTLSAGLGLCKECPVNVRSPLHLCFAIIESFSFHEVTKLQLGNFELTAIVAYRSMQRRRDVTTIPKQNKKQDQFQ